MTLEYLSEIERIDEELEKRLRELVEIGKFDRRVLCDNNDDLSCDIKFGGLPYVDDEEYVSLLDRRRRAYDVWMINKKRESNINFLTGGKLKI